MPTNQNATRRVVVAMSGGVDSSVAAAMLLEQGYEVIGMMLRLWSEPGKQDSNRCCTPESMSLARRVAAHLGIPFYALDIQDLFRRQIVEYFIEGYTQGITPNPCINCNRHIRFGTLLQRARSLGADFLATGHYARLRHSPDQLVELLPAVDLHKDQSYVLSFLRQDQLRHALFPIGEYPKSAVRDMARKFGLPVAERSDSQDLCFLAGDDYRNFLQRTAPQTNFPGPITDRLGRHLGQHQGLINYTIGQRKGLGISSQNPLFVQEKDILTNTLIVGERHELGRRELVAREVNWISGSPPPGLLPVRVKIRYKAREVAANVIPLENQSAKVEFFDLVRDITPGQAAVFYDDTRCLGGGIIQA